MSKTEPLEELLNRGYRFALSLTHDPAQAEDLLQDAWLAILKRGAPHHVGYLFRTIRNRFLDLERQRRLVAMEALEETSPSSSLGFLDEASHFPDRSFLDQALSELRSREREALFLAAVEGYTVQEIAQFTAQPLGSVSSLIQRARKKMQVFCAASFGRSLK